MVDNRGPNNLRDSLRVWLRHTQSLDLGVAFITRAGLNELLPAIQQVARRGRVRVLTGIYQAFTEPEALHALLRVRNETNGTLDLRISSTPHFHWKVYLLYTRGGLRAVVGSSNVTTDGLVGGAELNLVIQPGTDDLARRVREAFDDAWKTSSQPVSAEWIKRYAERRATRVVQTPSIWDLLVTPRTKTDKSAAETPPVRSYWRYWLEGFMEEETLRVVSQETNWERYGWDCMAVGRPIGFKQGDRILLFDLETDTIGVYEVKGIVRVSYRTPDGYHFVAYKKMPTLALRRLTPRRWRVLGRAGFRKSQIRQLAKVPLSKWKQTMRILSAA